MQEKNFTNDELFSISISLSILKSEYDDLYISFLGMEDYSLANYFKDKSDFLSDLSLKIDSILFERN